MIAEGLYINRDLFERYKIKEPEDYKELLDAVEGFNKVGITPIAFNVTPEGSSCIKI